MARITGTCKPPSTNTGEPSGVLRPRSPHAQNLRPRQPSLIAPRSPKASKVGSNDDGGSFFSPAGQAVHGGQTGFQVTQHRPAIRFYSLRGGKSGRFNRDLRDEIPTTPVDADQGKPVVSHELRQFGGDDASGQWGPQVSGIRREQMRGPTCEWPSGLECG
jgi:hypothetical protein